MASAFVAKAIKAHPVIVFSKSYCPFCIKAKNALKSSGASYEVIEIENRKGLITINLARVY